MTKADWIALAVVLAVSGGLAAVISYFGVKRNGRRGWNWKEK